MKQSYQTGLLAQNYPEGYVTRTKEKDRGRLKIYEEKNVYLKNEEEFEIELFNPTQETLLAKIELNGDLISNSGIILREGERVFLERYIDNNKRFKFETYEIENTDKIKEEEKNVNEEISYLKEECFTREKMSKFLNDKTLELEDNLKTIEKIKSKLSTLEEKQKELNKRHKQIDYAVKYNGSLKILFYKEEKIKPLFGKMKSIFNSNDMLNSNLDIDNNSNLLGDYYFSTCSSSLRSNIIDEPSLDDYKETGKIAEGSDSKQEFEMVKKEFENYTYHTIEYKILPISQKKLEKEDLRRYCTNCGKKLNKKDKFCSQCGTKV